MLPSLLRRNTKNKPSHGRVDDLTDEELLNFASYQLSKHDKDFDNRADELSLTLKAFDLTEDLPEFAQTLFWVFYRVDLIVLKLPQTDKYMTSYGGESAVSRYGNTRVSQQLPFWRRALGLTGRMLQPMHRRSKI